MSRNKLFSEKELLDLINEYTKSTDLPLTWKNVIEWAKIQYPGKYENLKDYHFSRYSNLQSFRKDDKSRRIKALTDTESSISTTQDLILDCRDFANKSPAELASFIESLNRKLHSIVKGSRVKEALIAKLKTENSELRKENSDLKLKIDALKNCLKEAEERNRVLGTDVQSYKKANTRLAGDINLMHLKDIGILDDISSEDKSIEINRVNKTFSAAEAEIIRLTRGDGMIEKKEEL